jgi:hypothetical protein
MQGGLIAIVAVLWIELRREERRRRLVRNLQSVLTDEDLGRSKEDHLKRAA